MISNLNNKFDENEENLMNFLNFKDDYWLTGVHGMKIYLCELQRKLHVGILLRIIYEILLISLSIMIGKNLFIELRKTTRFSCVTIIVSI